jgi:hypothetical protein
MSGKKALFLFLAFMLPVCVFLFLKIFGKNEFAVQPMFQKELPKNISGCGDVHLPYKLGKKIVDEIFSKNDSLVLIYFRRENPVKESLNQMRRIEKLIRDYPMKTAAFEASSSLSNDKRCVFLVKDPYDLVLVDHHGLIRGQYVSYDLDEMDRLLTEVDIILKKY